MKANPNPSNARFVIVNLGQATSWFDGTAMFYVLPSDEPTTFGTLETAAEVFRGLMNEYDHDLDSLGIFELRRVDKERVQDALNTLPPVEDDDVE